jgi:hypothetical protein
MDWLGFIASVIGSLAWPGVVLIVLWCNRQRLSSLPDWIEELTLPGGTKVKFTKALDKASAEARLLASEAPDTARFEGRVASSPVVEQFPEATVVQSFIELVETLGQMVQFLALPTKGRDPETVIRELTRLGYIDQKSVDLFLSLKRAYTAAVREGYVRLTAEEGLRYRQAAQVLNAQLREVLPRLERDNPRKREWG